METNNQEVSEFKKVAEVLKESVAAGTQEIQQVLEETAVAVDEMVEQSLREDAAVRAAASAAVADAVEQKKQEIFDRIEQVKDKAPYGSPEAPDMSVTKEVEALLDEIQEQRAEAQTAEESDEYARIYADVVKDLKKEVEGQTRIEKESKQRIVEEPVPLSLAVDDILPNAE